MYNNYSYRLDMVSIKHKMITHYVYNCIKTHALDF